MTGSPASSVRGGFPLGLTGATAATRYVGATASGAPASGTFAVGDFVIDQTGAIHVCTVAGSPGTWTEIGGGSGGMTAVETKVAPAGGSASFDFQSIPQTGQDLMVTFLGASEGAGNTPLNGRFNNDSTGIYDWSRLDGQDTTVAGQGSVNQTEWQLGELPGSSDTDRACAVTIWIPGYTRTTFFHSAHSHGMYVIGSANTEQGTRRTGVVWRSKAAISRFTLLGSANDIAEGSAATLYMLG